MGCDMDSSRDARAHASKDDRTGKKSDLGEWRRRCWPTRLASQLKRHLSSGPEWVSLFDRKGGRFQRKDASFKTQTVSGNAMQRGGQDAGNQCGGLRLKARSQGASREKKCMSFCSLQRDERQVSPSPGPRGIFPRL
jgi:hypothetical protein